jgi:predicted dehydrogenase
MRMEVQQDYTLATPKPALSINPARVLIIGAGSRGNAYAKAVVKSTNGLVAAVADPLTFKRQLLGSKYIWKDGSPREDQEFNDWREFIAYEHSRRARAIRGDNVPVGVDGVFVCTLDETHAEVITALAPLHLHIMSEKPLATTLQDCLSIRRALSPDGPTAPPTSIFAIGHVLRYSPHNMLLRKLMLQDELIGEIISMEHTEPVGWWHFAHSYVR